MTSREILNGLKEKISNGSLSSNLRGLRKAGLIRTNIIGRNIHMYIAAG